MGSGSNEDAKLKGPLASGRREFLKRGTALSSVLFTQAPGIIRAQTTTKAIRVGPVEIGDNAWIAGGTYITEDVPPESLAGFPPRQETKEGYLRGKRND